MCRERKNMMEEDVLMRTWKMEVGGPRKIARPKLRWRVVIQRHEGDTSTERTEVESCHAKT